MQTPKARTNSIRTPQRISPRSISSEACQKSSPRAEVSQKDSPRVVRQLKTSPRYSEPTASSATRVPKERSPKVSDRRSPLSEKKRPGRISELESQISQLENDLKNAKDQLCSSETSKEQAQKYAEESNQQLLALSTKIEDLQQQILEQTVSQKACIIEPHGRDETLLSELQALQKQHAHDLDALASALDEVDCLKLRLQTISESEATQIKHMEASQIELPKLKEELVNTLSIVEEMRNQLRDSKESEAQAQKLVSETLVQLEIAKKTVEMLRSGESKITEAYDVVSLELENSKARVSFLEEHVRDLKAEISCAAESKMQGDAEDELGTNDICCLKGEVEQLRSALQAAEMNYNQGRVQSAEEIRVISEMMDQIKSESGQREAELEAELRKSKYEIEELKSTLMAKETELQGICEENDSLVTQLQSAGSGQREKELEKVKGEIEKLKASLMDKDIEWNSVTEDNKKLKLQISEMSQRNEKAAHDLEAARAAEREALMKVGCISEEVDKCNRKVARVTEQLEAEQGSNTKMEGELRRLKVQCDQWRKAAEAATSMLTAGTNGHMIERTGSMDSSYCPRTRRIGSPYADGLDEDFVKKKNVNMLSRFGVLWKKQPKHSNI